MEPDIYRQLQKRLDELPVVFPETSSGVELRLLKQFEINQERCIGCGVCVPTCEGKAITLTRKKKNIVLSRNQQELYGKIYLERFGILKTVKFISKIALGQKA